MASTTDYARSTSATAASTIIPARSRTIRVTGLGAVGNDAACSIEILTPKSQNRTQVSEAAAANATTLKVKAISGFTAAANDTLVIVGFGVITASAASTAAGIVTYTVPALAKAVPLGTVLHVANANADRWTETIGAASVFRVGNMFSNGGPSAPIVLTATAASSKVISAFVSCDHLG